MCIYRIYLFKGRVTEKDTHHLLVHSSDAAMTAGRPGRRQEFLLHLLWGSGAQGLGLFSIALPGTLAGRQIGGGAAGT